MNHYLRRAERVLHRVIQLAEISEEAGCVTRTYGTEAFIRGRNLVKEWMLSAGLETRVDHIGNIRGRIESRVPNARTLVIGSHIDSVVNAGKFDGPLGVIMAIDLAEKILDSAVQLPFHLELVGFCDEEGVRFHSAYLGSRVLAGSFDFTLLDKKDDAGISLSQLISDNGGDVNQLGKDAIAPGDWLAYFEVHIEQGPVLFEKNVSAGIVSSIAGQHRASMVFYGEAGHAGTVPMHMRRDAMTAAAECIVAVEDYALRSNDRLVATVGKVELKDAASNVIPGEVRCSLDLRSDDRELLAQAAEDIRALVMKIASKRNIRHEWHPVQQSGPVNCDERLKALLSRAVEAAGFEKVQLVSGAGHDAVPVSHVAPVAMLFVRCFKGISHNPAENVELKDIAAAIEVSDNFIRLLMDNNANL